MNTPRDQLTAEIEFWRELVAEKKRERDGPVVERMRQALALAERKLHLLDSAGAELRLAPDKPPRHLRRNH